MAEGSILSDRFLFRDNFNTALLGSKALKAKQAFSGKIKSGAYKFEDCNCYCGSGRGIILSEIDRYGNYYPFVICGDCGIMRANPRLSEPSYIGFYENEYRALYGDDDCDLGSLYKIRLGQAEEVFNFISRHMAFKKDSVVFDIGCNMGTMLLPFLRHGCKIAGVDYGRQYIEYGKNRGNPHIEAGGIDKLFEKDEKADLVILNHVLEHFVDLRSELTKVRRLLKPGGFLYISLPGTFWWVKHRCKDDILGLLQNAHLWQFSLDTLKYVLECSGFQLIYGNNEVRAIFKECDDFRERFDLPENEFRKTMCYLIRTEKKLSRKLYWIKTLKLGLIKKVLKKYA